MTRLEKIIDGGREIGDTERMDRVLMLVEEYGLEIILAVILKQLFGYSCDGVHENNVHFIQSLCHEDALLLLEALEHAFTGIDDAQPVVLH